jgi:flagella basal body P-ring formation protein FlgA
MNRSLRIIVLIAAVSATAVSISAAELRLRQQCTPQSSLTTLGDVAEIFSADAAQADALKKIELFPSPSSDQPRMLRVRELQDLLATRGVNLAEHRFSGSAQVQIAPGKKRSDSNLPLSEQAIKRAQRRVQEAVLKYLQEQGSSSQPRTVQFDLTAAQQRALGTASAPISVRGGAAPWTGSQQLTLSVDGSDGPASFSLEVRVSVPSSVVAALHSISRGAIIRAADLTLVHGDPRDDGENGAFHNLEEVAGKQASKAIAEGKVLTPDAVQAPLLIRRGDVVTVYAKTAGIHIHITARAKDDGAMSDLVTVESLTDRKSFTARVCGPRETEVFAQAAAAE